MKVKSKQPGLEERMFEKYKIGIKKVRSDRTHNWFSIKTLRMTIKLKKGIRIKTWLRAYITDKFGTHTKKPPKTE